MTGPSEWKKMSNFFSIIIGQKEVNEEEMKNPYVSFGEVQELPRFTVD